MGREEEEEALKCFLDCSEFTGVHIYFPVPPTSSVILDERGARADGRIGPFNEMSTLILTCDVLGGEEETLEVSLKTQFAMLGIIPQVGRRAA